MSSYFYAQTYNLSCYTKMNAQSFLQIPACTIALRTCAQTHRKSESQWPLLAGKGI